MGIQASHNLGVSKVENIQEDSLDLIPLPSPLVKIQIISRKIAG
jgi:hypothetical protein